MITQENIKAAVKVVIEVTRAVHDAGALGIPEGPLYAGLMASGAVQGIEGFESLKRILLNTNLVASRGNCLYWVGEKMKGAM